MPESNTPTGAEFTTPDCRLRQHAPRRRGGLDVSPFCTPRKKGSLNANFDPPDAGRVREPLCARLRQRSLVGLRTESADRLTEAIAQLTDQSDHRRVAEP